MTTEGRSPSRVHLMRARRCAAAALLGLALAFGPAALVAAADSPDAAAHYVCPPCGQPCDSAVYDAPGTCPKCGMALVAQGSVAPDAHPRKKVALLIFDGVQIIDYTGPYEVFGAAGFDVYTVAATKDPITTAMGMTVVPKYDFAGAPQPDVLVVPGGGIYGAQKSAPTLKWIADVSSRAEHTMSVCNGAFLLADAGLLDGLTATTTSSRIDQLRADYPKIHVVDDRRFVDNGKIITTAGLSSGIDGALHVVAQMLGNGEAQQAALSEEYDWRPKSGFARAALADRNIPDIRLEGAGQWTIERTEGQTDRWEIALRGTSDLTAAQLTERIGGELAAKGHWTPAKSPSSGTGSAWKFTGRDGKPWTGTLAVQQAGSAKGEYAVRLTIARAG